MPSAIRGGKTGPRAGSRWAVENRPAGRFALGRGQPACGPVAPRRGSPSRHARTRFASLDAAHAIAPAPENRC
jgi:hypothetical protein